MEPDLPESRPDEQTSDSQANNHKKKFYWKKARVLAIFGIIEVVSLVLWQKADDFFGFPAYFIHWLSQCGFLAGGVYLAHELSKSRIGICFIWVSFAALCAVLFVTKPPDQKPNFIFSLQIGNAVESKVFLTNSCLFITNFNISFFENDSGISPDIKGCLVIPVHSGESNEVFVFTAENNSLRKVNDLEFAVTFPKSWNCSADSKWHSGDFFLKETPTSINHIHMAGLQTWTIPVSWTVFPGDDVIYPPITNTCFDTYTNQKSKAVLMAIEARCSDFANSIIASVIFFKSSSNFSTPFVVEARLGSDGLFHFSIPSELLEKMQK